MLQTILEQAYKCRYKHVNITTVLKKSPDFESEFSVTCLPDSTNTGNHKAELVFEGYLKTIDPITSSAILSAIDSDGEVKNILVLGQHIRSIELSGKGSLQADRVEQILVGDSIRKAINHPYFRRGSRTKILSEHELQDRQEDILHWLSKNRIPAEYNKSSDEITVADCIRIKAPYEHIADYICPTGVVLKRIKRIVDCRPERKII